MSWPVFQMAPDYDHLTLMEKVEVFEHAVNNTAGDDLAKLLWLKSPSSEVRQQGGGFGAPHPHIRHLFLMLMRSDVWSLGGCHWR